MPLSMRPQLRLWADRWPAGWQKRLRLMKATVDAAGQGRIVGTIMGSEVDRDDLGTDWKREDRNDHLVATLAYNDHD